MNNEKQEIRRRFLEYRKALSQESVENRSFRIAQKCRALITSDIRSVLFYVPINHEVDLLQFARELVSKKITVLFPKVIRYEKIEAHLVNDFERDFQMGAYHIPEPETENFKGPIDIAFVPGIAFGKNGYRIGYGKSYYDRFLFSGAVKLTVGVCYDFQLMPTVPHTETDYQLHWILTENESIEVERSGF